MSAPSDAVPSAGRLTSGAMVATGFAALRATLWVVEAGNGGQEMTAQTGALEIGPAGGVKPPVDARDMETAAVNGMVAVDAGD